MLGLNGRECHAPAVRNVLAVPPLAALVISFEHGLFYRAESEA